MAVDHSRIYTDGSWRNFGHRARAKAIAETIRSFSLPEAPAYVDVGCSNGFLTKQVAEWSRAADVTGLDHNEENLERARSSYPQISFKSVDLNCRLEVEPYADLVTCFETLEHVGDPATAVENLFRLAKADGVLFITVPIESGMIGALKFLAKVHLLNYSLDELCDTDERKRAYRRAVLRGGKVSGFRDPRPGWGTHFGFEYRDLEADLRDKVPGLRAWTVGTSRFFVCRKPSQPEGIAQH